MPYNPVFSNNNGERSFNNGGFSYFKANTDGCVLFNGDKMLRISYLDTSMKFEIRTRNPDPNAQQKFIKAEKPEDEISIVLTVDRVAEICKSLEKFMDVLTDLQDKHNKHEAPGNASYSIGVFTNNNVGNAKVFEIATGVEGPKGYQPEIYIHLGIGDDRKPTKSDCFKTTSGNVLINYNGGTNEDTEVIDDYPQFITIVHIFHNFIEQYGKATAHFAKTKSINDFAHMVDVVDRIAMQMGIPVKQQMKTGGDYGANAKSSTINSAPVQYTSSDLSSAIDNLPY